MDCELRNSACFLFIPSQGRGAVGYEVAGRGLQIMHCLLNPPCTLPSGGNRTRPGLLGIILFQIVQPITGMIRACR